MPLKNLVIVLAAALFAGGCDLDLLNPNALTEEEVLSSRDGLIALAVGMQDLYAGNVDNFVQAPALVTDEWGTKSLALLAWTSLLTGENFDRSLTSTVEAPWAASYQVIKAADNVIEAAPQVGLGPTFTAALTAMGQLYRGMALGQLYLHYESAVLAVDEENPPAVDRAQLLEAALTSLEAARTAWAQTDPADLAGFNSRVKNPEFDVGNTIDAMLARYHLFAGNWQEAADAADRVDLTVISFWEYDTPDENPIYDLSFDANYVAGLQSWADEAEPGDQRVGFWLDLTADAPQSNTDTLLAEFGQYSEPGDAFPVYLPDEMKLIMAEAHARLGDLPTARTLVNEVRTQCGPVVEEPAPCLPPLSAARLDTEAELLEQIAYERRYELYMQGLRWEDMRRMDVIPDVYTLQFLPIPLQECLANTSIPC